MSRRTCAASFVWCWTCHRKMSPTLMCTRSRSCAIMIAWVPLPLPWTPMITYFRMPAPCHRRTGKASRHAGLVSPAGCLDTAGQVDPKPEVDLAGLPRLEVQPPGKHAEVGPLGRCRVGARLADLDPFVAGDR